MIPRDETNGDLMLPPIAPRAQVPSAYIPNEIEDPNRGPIRLLWRRRWSVVAVIGICMLGAWVYLRKTPLTFYSEARVYVQEKGAALVGADTPGMVNNNDSYLYLQGELIKSNEILDRVAKLDEVAKLPTIAGLKDPVRTLRANLVVEVDNHLSVIDLKYSSTTPLDAVTIVNKVMDEFVDTHINPKKFGSNRVLKVLQEQQVKEEVNLKAAQDKVADFRSKHGAISFEGEKGNVVIVTLDRLSSALTEAQLGLITAQTNYESALAMQMHDELWTLMMAKPMPDPSAVLAANASVELQQLQMQLNQMSGDYGAENPARRSLSSRIALVQKNYTDAKRSVENNYVSALKAQFESAKVQADNLDKAVHDQQTKALELNSESTEYEMLNVDLTREQKLASTLDEQIKGTQINESAGALNITQLAIGDPQNLDIEPRPHKVLAMAGVMGITLGMVCAFLQDMLDRRIRSADEVRARLRKRVLGAIPHVRGSHSIAGLGRQVDLDPASDASEAFRIVSTSIHLGMPSRRLRAILVTSPHQGDGKTIIASNLAIAMAKTGRRTLLLDADMRNPTTHRIYSLDNRVGLSSILSGETQAGASVQASGIECLDILTAGPIPHNPSELLNNRNFRKLLKDLSEAYDSVVIDAPPVGRFADALIVGAVCKATVLVMRAAKCTLKDGEDSLEHLTAAGAAVLGVVVNDLSPRVNRYSSYAAHYARKLRAKPVPRVVAPARVHLTTAAAGGGMQVLVAPKLQGRVVEAEHGSSNGNGADNGHGSENGNGADNGNGHEPS
jgi:capsular exopolysaccharide synthesis family protein